MQRNPPTTFELTVSGQKLVGTAELAGFSEKATVEFVTTDSAKKAQFSIRAASSEPVDGWQRIQLNDKAVWVSPRATITARDIEHARVQPTPDGLTVDVVFTDAAAEKIRELTIAQRNKLIALVVGEKLISATTLRSEIGKRFSLTGNGPNGLTKDEVVLIMDNLK